MYYCMNFFINELGSVYLDIVTIFFMSINATMIGDTREPVILVTWSIKHVYFSPKHAHQVNFPSVFLHQVRVNSCPPCVLLSGVYTYIGPCNRTAWCTKRDAEVRPADTGPIITYWCTHMHYRDPYSTSNNRSCSAVHCTHAVQSAVPHVQQFYAFTEKAWIVPPSLPIKTTKDGLA